MKKLILTTYLFQVFMDKRQLLLHVSDEHDSKRIQCGICEMKFQQISSLLIHLRSDHESTRFNCNLW